MNNPELKFLAATVVLCLAALLMKDESEPSLRQNPPMAAFSAESYQHAVLPRWRLTQPGERAFSAGKRRNKQEAWSGPQIPGRIGDELVIQLPAGMSLAEFRRLTGVTAEVVGQMDRLNAYRLKFADEAAADYARALLDAAPHLAGYEDNYRLAKPAFSPEAEGAAVLQPNSLRVGDANGQLIVGLVDTAVQSSGSGFEDYLLPSISVTGDAAAQTGELQHGTAMASAILQGMSMVLEEGSATSARILPVDVYGNAETTTTYQVAEGVVAALEAGATVISLSLGSSTASPLLENIIQQGYDQGVVFLGAAGNTSTVSPTYPAAYPEVIAVTSVDYTGAISAYANYGDFVDVGTPGAVVVDVAGNRQVVTGTSVSTALATGITVGLAEKGGTTADKVENSIRSGLAVH